MLADHDVFITDWNNARDIPLAAGRFGTDEYVEHLIRFHRSDRTRRACGGGVPALCGDADRRGGDGEAAKSRHARSMTLMAGPVDASINPTDVNRFATRHPISWFKKNLIARVPNTLSRRRTARLSGLHSGQRLSVDEPRPPYPRPMGFVRSYSARPGAGGQCQSPLL